MIVNIKLTKYSCYFAPCENEKDCNKSCIQRQKYKYIFGGEYCVLLVLLCCVTLHIRISENKDVKQFRLLLQCSLTHMT
jgi:hypothetical protein